MDWLIRIEDCISEGSMDAILEVLTSLATPHAGTAKSKDKVTIIKRIRKIYQGAPEDLFRFAASLCQSGNFTAQEISSELLADCFPAHESEIVDMLIQLADSPNWEVREWAASACGRILESSFNRFYPTIYAFAADDRVNVRRAALLAVMYAGKSRNPAYADRILDVVECLLSDSEKYIRDNLGPFALGSAIIRYYPEQVLGRLQTWVGIEDEPVRLNLAKMFTAADSAQYAPYARREIEVLTHDNRPSVKRAVKKALENIQKRCPEFFDRATGDPFR